MIDPRTAELLKRYVLAGGAVGAGLGAGTSIANYLSYLNDKGKQQRGDTSKDDDILYVDIPHTKRANVTGFPGVGGGIALAGGVLAMGGANAMVNYLYKKIKKKKLQTDLDEAQQLYWDSDGTKSASVVPPTVNPGKPISTAELVTSAPVALTLLAAVASGAVTNKALSHYFPARDKGVNPLKDAKPKQVKIRYVDHEDITKQSAACIPAAMDFALSSLVSGLDKSSSYLPDLVATAAQGNLEGFINNLRDHGPVTALELTKGASVENQDPDKMYLGICALNRNPETAPLVASLLDAEIVDRLPFFHKIASETEDADQEVVVKLAAAISNSVTEGIIDRNTDENALPEDDEVEENTAHESGATPKHQETKGYGILSKILSQNKGPGAPKKEEDIVDLALAGS